MPLSAVLRTPIGYLEYDSFNNNYTFNIYYAQLNQFQDVYALQQFGNTLFIGGKFTNWVSTNYVAYINSNDYPSPFPHSPGNGLNGIVNCFKVYNGELFAGGSFSMSGSTSVSNIAKWNGTTWSAVGTGTNGTVSSLTVYNNELIVGGYFTNAGGTSVNNIAKWNGSNWTALGNGLSGSGSKVTALKVYGTNLFAGGIFAASGSTSLSNLAKWNGIAWSAMGTGTNGQVICMEAFNNRLYIGGNFTQANGAANNYIVAYNDGSSTLVSETIHAIKYKVYPNPTSGKLAIDFGSEQTAHAPFNMILYDITGAIIQETKEYSSFSEIHLENLHDGLYFLRVLNTNGNLLFSTPVIKM